MIAEGDLGPQIVETFDYLIDAVRSSETTLRQVASVATEWRGLSFVEFAGIGFFLAFMRRELANAFTLYELVFSNTPLKAWRQGGIKNEHIEHVRRAIFFYLLFLFYLAVQFPLTFGPSNSLETAADLTIQLALLFAVLSRVSIVKKSLDARHQADEERRKDVREWLDNSLGKMGIKFNSLRWKAAAVFFTSVSLLVAQASPALAQGIIELLELLRGLA